MSLRSKRGLSAFAVLKARKTNSLSSVTTNVTPKPSLGKKSKSLTNSAALTNGIVSSANSTDKKKTSQIKRIKNLMKSASKKRPSFLSDNALNSPLKTKIKAAQPVLRSASKSTSNGYPVPVRATPDTIKRRSAIQNWDPNDSFSAINEGKRPGVLVTTPPLPPKSSRAHLASKAASQTGAVKSGKKRSSIALDDNSMTPELPPRLSRTVKQVPLLTPASPCPTDNDIAPPRPAKRRRTSQGSAPPTPEKNSSRLTGVFSPDGARERMELVPLHPQQSQPSKSYMFDSREEAKRLFECLIHPVVTKKFFSELWEKKPLLVKRHQPSYNEGWFSTSELDRILREEHIKFSENLDVVTYENGKRETHNPEGRAHAAVVWDYYQNGCSVRLLNPHTYSKNVWKLLSVLQEYFGCCVGANVYLTPPGTQGFAPHWDDIEAFILQLEGKKHWKLYSPRSESEVLPRYSSANLAPDEIGKPILDVILEAGDLLYFPRGTIHQGCTMDDEHSLHITVSCYQKNTWGDLMEQLVPQALKIAIDEDVEFRKALPRDYLNYMGVAFSDKDCSQRQSFLRRIEQLMHQLITYAPVDAACDQMGKKFIYDSLPPMLTEAEKFCSIHGQGERWDASQKRVVRSVKLELHTRIKLIRQGCTRLVTEDNKVYVYHNLENARVYHDNEIQSIEITPEIAPAVEFLLHSYPEYVSVDSLPLDDIEDKIQLISALYDKGLIVTQEPLPHTSDVESDSESTALTPSASKSVSRRNSRREK